SSAHRALHLIFPYTTLFRSVPETHRLVAAAGEAGVELASEIELAYRWEQTRPGGPRPILAITGTDGKTTTTELTVAILLAAGLRSEEHTSELQSRENLGLSP